MRCCEIVRGGESVVVVVVVGCVNRKFKRLCRVKRTFYTILQWSVSARHAKNVFRKVSNIQRAGLLLEIYGRKVA